MDREAWCAVVMGSQRVGHDWATELNWTYWIPLWTRLHFHFHFSLSCIEEGNGNPLQCSCLENPRDGLAYGIAQRQTGLKRLSSSSSSSSSLTSPLPNSNNRATWSDLASQVLSFSHTFESGVSDTEKEGQFKVNVFGGSKEWPVRETSQPQTLPAVRFWLQFCKPSLHWLLLIFQISCQFYEQSTNSNEFLFCFQFFSCLQPKYLTGTNNSFEIQSLSNTANFFCVCVCNKVLLKYKGDRESFWYRHQKGAKEYPFASVSNGVIYSPMNPKNVWRLQRPHQTHSHNLHFKITELARRFNPKIVLRQDTSL